MMGLIAQGATVLIADDDPMFCVMLTQFFKVNGYEAVSVEDGEKAVQAFNQHKPALILLDGDMPEMDGFAACEMIRSLEGGDAVPIYIVTALEGQAALDCAVEVGASDYVSKPIQWPELRNKLSCVLDITLDE